MLGNAAALTHYAEGVEVGPNQIQLLRMYGPDNQDGIPTLEFVNVYVPDQPMPFSAADTAAALIFVSPDLTVLSPKHAGRALAAIKGAPGFLTVQEIIAGNPGTWNNIVLTTDNNGQPMQNAAGHPLFEYQLILPLLNALAAAATGAIQQVYSDPELRDVRWRVRDGVACIDQSSPPGSRAGDVKARAAGAVGYQYAIQDAGPNYGLSIDILGLDDDLNLTIELDNTLIRHVSVFAKFLDADGNAISIPEDIWTAALTGDTLTDFQDWAGQGACFSQLIQDQTNTYQFLGLLSPEDVFMGVPVSEGSTQRSFKIPQTSTTIGTIQILCGSMGVNQGATDPDDQSVVPLLGFCATAFADLALPIISMLLGVGEESETLLNSTLKDVPFMASCAKDVCGVVYDLIRDPVNTAEDLKAALLSISDDLVKAILSASDVAAKLAAFFGAEEAEEAVPVVGWALKAAALLATGAQIDQTIGEVIGAPQVVSFNITVSMTAVITLYPDPTDQAGFPAKAASFTLVAQFSDNTSRKATVPIDNPHVEQLQFEFDNMPIGGNVVFAVSFLSSEGWLVGKGQTASMANAINSDGVLAASITITELEYRLDADTTYSFQRVITSDGSSHQWQEGGNPPSETTLNIGSGGQGNYLEELDGIVFNNSQGLIGYTWLANGGSLAGSGDAQSLYAFQSLSISPTPDSGLNMVPQGFLAEPQLGFPGITTAQTGQTDFSCFGFYVDPTGSPETGYYLRGLIPDLYPGDPPNSSKRIYQLPEGMSWGRFRALPASLALHSNGFVVGVNPEVPKLFILELDQARPDSNTRHAVAYSGPGTREGLLNSPELVAVAPDQTIFVLDSGNARIAAFSRGGHPVKQFPKSSSPYWIPIDTTNSQGQGITYLALSVELTGYIYVLSYEDTGYLASQFRLDVFTPTGERLFRQNNVNVASLVVDFWRNLYSENYQMITGIGGRVEPSVSEWIPNTPPGGLRK